MIDQLIQQIADIQATADGKYFPNGIFPSYRQNKFIHYKRPDNTIFFTAITVFTLQKLKPFLSELSQKLVEEITKKAILNYPNYQNKDGLKTYNFFPTCPPKPFGNGYLLHRFNYFELPDDIDDTALIYLTQQHSETDILWLKNKLAQHANGVSKNIKNTFPEYKTLKAYSTWFGKNMYIEFDACVLCNILYCVFEYQLPLNEYDKDSLKYLQQIILSNQYLKKPFNVAHHYVRTEIIIYHIARLMAAFEIEELEECREKLVRDIEGLLEKKGGDNYSKILLETSLLRLTSLETSNHSSPPAPSGGATNSPAGGWEAFFIAGFLTAFENPLIYRFAPNKLFHFEWTCEAHTLALLAENLVLKK